MRFFAIFFFFINRMHLTRNKQSKMVSLKNSFSQRYSRKTFAQYNTVQSRTPRSITLRGVGLCAV